MGETANGSGMGGVLNPRLDARGLDQKAIQRLVTAGWRPVQNFWNLTVALLPPLGVPADEAARAVEAVASGQRPRRRRVLKPRPAWPICLAPGCHAEVARMNALFCRKPACREQARERQRAIARAHRHATYWSDPKPITGKRSHAGA